MTPPAGRARLELSPSLNRTVLADLPGLPDGMAGSQANSWLAAWGITRRMAARLDARTPASAPGPVALDRLVSRGDPDGIRLADDLGLALGALIATLVTGSETSRAGRPDWPAEQWDRWGSVRRIALGGGLVRGPLGVRLVSAARAWVARTGLAVGVDLVDRPEGLVLRGAVTLLRDTGVVLDCGATTVKSAVRRSPGGPVVAGAPVAAPHGSGPEVLDALTGVIVGLAPHVPGSGELPIALAVATYVDETGQPYAGQLGPYAPLGDLDLRAVLTALVVRAVGRPVSLQTVHDGAAALLGAREADPRVDAAIVLGTSIGSGLR